MTPHACPKYGAACEKTREVPIDRKNFPVFQCDTCQVPWEIDGETFPTAFTFCVNAAGQWFDPLTYGDPGLN